MSLARDAHAASGRATSFEISVFAGFAGAQAQRRRLADLGVDRLILPLQPPYAELRHG